jgi:hypothetical protein
MDAHGVRDHNQALWILDYLAQCGAKMIVVETEYVDRDYLDDYAMYYAKVFTDFAKRCKRVHFFQRYDPDGFADLILTKRGLAAFEEAYLGFVVVRPLPEAIIGRTVLRTYPEDAGKGERRFYRAVSAVPVHLFGVRLTVKASLPFQQQDRVIASCATVALWSALHATANVFGTRAPRPGEITIAATEGYIKERIFPSKGLTFEQLCLAVRAIGLEPYLFSVDEKSDPETPKAPEFPVLSWIRAYLEMKLPVILGVRLPDGRKHAVTVAGYRESPEPVHVRESSGGRPEAPSVGRKITHLFCHDDNLVPFASYKVVTNKKGGGNLRFEVKDYDHLVKRGRKPIVRLYSGLVPLNGKVRLDFIAVQQWITVLDDAVHRFMDDVEARNRSWNVRLGASIDLKDEFRGLPLSDDAKRRLLLEPHPHYLWCATLDAPNREVLRLLIDATAFEDAIPIRRAVIQDRELIKKALNPLKALSEKPVARRLYEVLAAEITDST